MWYVSGIVGKLVTFQHLNSWLGYINGLTLPYLWGGQVNTLAQR